MLGRAVEGFSESIGRSVFGADVDSLLSDASLNRMLRTNGHDT